MGYGIYRIEKRTKNAVGGIKKENNRTKEEKEKWEAKNLGKTYLPNSDIDWEKTKDNYYFKKDDEWYKTIAKEIDQLNLPKAPRKDAIVLLDHFVGISPEDADEMDEKALKGYFKDAYEYIQKEYGHVVNAVVHLDEKTAHMHVVTVPVTKDGRLSAKSLTSGSMSFRQVQDRFYKEVSKKYGLKRGEPKAETSREHLEKREWKAKELEKEVNFLESEKTRVNEDYRFAVEEKESLQDSIAKLQVEESRKRRSIEANQNTLKIIETDINLAKTELADLKTEISDLKTEISDLKAKREEILKQPPKTRYIDVERVVEVPKEVVVEKIVEKEVVKEVEVNYKTMFQKCFKAFQKLVDWIERKFHCINDLYADLGQDNDFLQTWKTAYPQSKAKTETLRPDGEDGYDSAGFGTRSGRTGK